jgi:hypothetical protein
VTPPTPSPTPPDGVIPPPPTPPDEPDNPDTPLALDWSRAGAFHAIADTVTFDVRGDGRARAHAWLAPSAAWLALDLDGNGRIDSGAELFGSATRLANGAKARDGFAALAQYDDDHDGRIDARDAVFARLLLWRDADGDGRAQPAELVPLASTDVVALELAASPAALAVTRPDGSASGLTIGLESRYVTRDGRAHRLVDIYVSRQEAAPAVADAPLRGNQR